MNALSSLLSFGMDIVSIISSCVLRSTVVYFVRWLPLGPRFLPIINTSALVYFSTIVIQAITTRKRANRKTRSQLVTLLLGRYDPSSTMAKYLTVLINILCLAVSLDFVYRGEFLHQSEDVIFSRVGFVDSASAKIVFRSPFAPTIQVEYKQQSSPMWEIGSVVSVSSDNDYVGAFYLNELSMNTTYLYRTNATHVGSFHTPPSHPEKWSMVSSSCMSPFFPYSPTKHSLHLPGLSHLSAYISTRPIDFMLFLGDFIYIDLPIRFGFSQVHYTTAYRKIYASPSWSSLLKALPWLHTYDDHEITNDWAGSGNDTDLYNDAMPPWKAYQQSGNPKALRNGVNHYSFQKGDVSFFVLDTRRYRSNESMQDGPSKTMLGKQQLADVLAWLGTEKGLKVLVSSVPFTRNWRGPESIDSWAGYLFERQKILAQMWKTEGVVIISGVRIHTYYRPKQQSRQKQDRHEHATTQFPSPNGKSNVVEFSTSPLSQFYQPFDRQYRQEEGSDVMVKYHPFGISKFGVFNFDTSNTSEWKLGFDLIVDGKREWSYLWSADRSD